MSPAISTLNANAQVPNDFLNQLGLNLASKILESFGVSPTIIGTCICTSLVSTIVSFISSIYLISTTNSGRYFVHAIPLVSSATAMVAQFAAIIHTYTSFKFDMAKATTVIQSLAERHATQMAQHSNDPAYSVSNAWDFAVLLKYTMKLVVVLVTAGMTKLGWSVSDLNTFLTFNDKSGKFATEATDFVSDILVEAGVADLQGKAGTMNAFQSLLTKSQELLALNTGSFVTDVAQYNSLCRTIQDINEIMTRKLSDSEGKQFSSIKTTLGSTLFKLVELKSSVDMVMEGKVRVATYGFLFEGNPGVGKSEFATYIMSKIARTMHLPNNVYDFKMTSSGKFARPYGNEPFGIFNEFANTVGPDSQVENLNSIISSDPYSFESAFIKEQPCKLRVVSLTSNKSTYESLMTSIAETSICALFSRLIRVEVIDPKFEGRFRENQHRKSDFTHLKLKVKTTISQQPTTLNHLNNVATEEISIEELTHRMVKQCAQAEIYYYNKMLVSFEDTDPRRPVVQARIDFCRGLIAGISGQSTSCAAGSLCAIRFQGGVGAYKSTTIESTANQLQRTFGMPIKKISTDVDFPLTCNEPMIYIFDDFCFKKYYQEYLDFTNRIDMNSIVLIGSNHVVPFTHTSRFGLHHITNAKHQAFAGFDCNNVLNPFSSSFFLKMFLKFLFFLILVKPTKAYCPTESNLHFPLAEVPGLGRRLGFMTRILDSGRVTNLPSPSGLCFTVATNGTYHTSENVYYPHDVPNIVVDHYLRFLLTHKEIPIVTTNAPVFEPDVQILINDFDQWKEAVKTVDGYAQMYLQSDHPAGRVIVRKEMESVFLSQAQITYWLIPDLKEVKDIEPVIRTLCNTLRNAIPGIAVVVSSDTFSYSYYNGLIYTRDSISRHIHVEADGENFIYNGKIIPALPIFQFIENPTLITDLRELHTFTGSELTHIKAWFASSHDWKTKILYSEASKFVREASDQQRDVARHPIIAALKETPLAIKIITGILSVFSIAGITYFFYNIFSSKSKKTAAETIANISANPEIQEKLDQMNIRYVQGVQSGKYSDTIQFRNQLKAENVDDREIEQWQAYNDYLRSNSKMPDNAMLLQSIVKSISSGDKPIAETLLQQYNSKFKLSLSDIQLLTSATSNAVPQKEEISVHNPILQQFSTVLKAATFKLINKVRGGQCYGLLIKRRYFVTVSHIFEEGDELAAFWAGGPNPQGREWPASILYINRALDLAIGEITDKTFPMTKDLTSHLRPTTTTTTTVGTSYYVRSLSSIFIYSGSAVRHQFNNVTRYDAANPNYRPQDYYTYTWTQMLDVKDIFSIGDCGLPLVSIIDGKAYILAVHNGFSMHGTAYFSPVNSGIFTVLTNKDAVTTVANCSKPSVLYNTPVLDLPQYNDAIQPGDIGKRTHWDNYKEQLDILGRSKDLYYFSRPQYTKKNLHDEKCLLENPSLPAANTSDLTEEARQFLAKDSKGRPHPLMTQALKFGGNPTPIYDKDMFQHAKQIQKQVYSSVLQPLKILRPAAAINGIFGESLKAVVLETSPGPDIKRKFKLNTKKEIFKNVKAQGETPFYCFTDHPAAIKVQQDMTAIFDNWCGGIQTSIISKDNPKVELLPRQKVEQEGKVRLFCEIDLAVNLVIKRLAGDFMSQVNESHFLLNVKTGVNPYRDLHWAAKNHPKEWDKFGFDVKRMDKYLLSEFIFAFFELIESLLEKRDQMSYTLYRTAAKSISNRIHIIEGILYRVYRGNPSGLVGTNHINACSLELILIYGLIKTYSQITPDINFITNHEYMARIRGFLNGDNGYIVTPPSLALDQEKIQSFFKDFCMEVLFDKSDLEGIEWCGREIQFVDGFLFPALRKEAIVRQIFWVQSKNTLDYPMQCLLVQLEASLHDKKFYEMVQHDIRHIARKICCNPHSITYLNYEDQRHHFKRYIAGEANSPVITGQLPECLYPYKVVQPIMEAINWVGRYNERCARDKLPTNPHTEQRQDSTTLTWFIKVTDQGYVGEGSGARKATAKNVAYSILFENRFGAFDETISNADRRMHKHSIRYTCEPDKSSDGNLVRIYFDDKLVLDIETQISSELVSSAIKTHLTDMEAWQGAFFAFSALTGSCVSTSNADRNPNLNKSAAGPVVPTGTRTPMQPASQATSTIGQPEPPPTPLLAAGGVASTTVLNPFGPINRMTEGGITVDLPTLVYSQMMDSNQTLHVTDSMPAGTIIAQIPWDPTNEYVNKYIKTYVSLHGRANGDIKYRVTMVSNQTFSGGVIIFWHPKRYTQETVDRAEAQKYAYQVLTTTMPSAENFILKDARQIEYYRRFPIADPNSLPHLVIAVHLPLRSPLKPGVSCDIVLGSQLCSEMDMRLYGATPFVVAEPLVSDFGPNPTPDSLNGKSLGLVFPSYSLKYLTLALDGRTYQPSLNLIEGGTELYFDMHTMLPCLYGGKFPDNTYRRLVSTTTITHTVGADEVRVVFVILRCTPLEEQSIANDPDFIKCSEEDNWLTKCKNMAWLRSVIPINVARTNSTALNLYTKETTTLDLVQQTSFVGRRGQGYVQCYLFKTPTNSLDAASVFGIPNSSQPIRPMIPHNPVLGPMDTSDGLDTLPPSWAKCVMTTQPLGVVSGNSEIALTTVDDPVFIKYFQDRSETLTSIECLQFKLLEPTTQTVVATIRYLHTSKVFCVSPVDGINYKIYPSNANNLIFDEFSVVRTTSGFAPSDTTSWLTRFPTSFFNGKALTHSNAFVAAIPELLAGEGAIAGIEAGEGGLGTITEMDAAMDDLGQTIRDNVPQPSWGQGIDNAWPEPTIPNSFDVGTQSTNNMRDAFSQTRSRQNFNNNTSRPQNYSSSGPSNKFINSNNDYSINSFTQKNYQQNYYTSYAEQNSKLTDFLMYGMIPQVLASAQSNGAMIDTPIKMVNGNMQAGYQRDFVAQQNDLQRQHDQLMQDQNNVTKQQMQNNAFIHDTSMESQKEKFSHDENQQAFAHQDIQQNNAFQHDTQMQQGAFQHSDQQQQQSFGHDIEMEGRQFAHGLINTATGGALGMANTVVGKVGDALLEKQRFGDQSKLMAQNARLQVQTAGQTSQSLQISQNQ